MLLDPGARGRDLVEMFICLATTIGLSVSDSAFNVDAQAGLSYWFSPTTKISVGYRFDEYFKALKTLTASSAFTTVCPTITSSNLNRSFSGPTVRLTSKF